MSLKTSAGVKVLAENSLSSPHSSSSLCMRSISFARKALELAGVRVPGWELRCLGSSLSEESLALERRTGWDVVFRWLRVRPRAESGTGSAGSLVVLLAFSPVSTSVKSKMPLAKGAGLGLNQPYFIISIVGPTL